MFSNMDVLKIYSQMARHAAEAQTRSAANIAHADDPGYRAQEIESFQDFLERTASGTALETGFRTADTATPAKPNGNTVSVEHELYKSAEAMDQHQMALTVYQKSLELLRTAIGRR